MEKIEKKRERNRNGRINTETEQVLFQFLLYKRRRHCTTRRLVHDVGGRTPTHTQYIFRCTP